MRRKFIGVAFAALAAVLAGSAHAQDKKVTIGVSIPAADHGWTAGVVYHAERVAKLLMQEHPGLNVIVKTSPDAANQANALQDLAVQGLCVAVAVLLYVPRLASTSATTGMLWELQAITAVVVGGTALRGGVGRIWGTICGAFILEIVGNIMILSNFVSEYLIGAIQGAIIIIAMLVQRSLSRR